MESDKNRSISPFGILIIASALIGIALFVYAFFIEPNRLVLNQNEIRIDGWNKVYEGFKIVSISDLHGGSAFVDEQKIRDVVELANAQDPDLIVLLGDFVSQTGNGPIRKRPLKMPMATIADNLKGFKARFGTIAVLGNHDGWYDDETVQKELRRAGITVLRNEVETVYKDGAALNILGLKPAPNDGTFENIRDVLKESGDVGK
ncbi:MAG: hypothetical protein HKN25_01175 [Pyrinomonadaceae bacterium]|nr:hypothetical protein [Pyrinomonadaceae bacterium]